MVLLAAAWSVAPGQSRPASGATSQPASRKVAPKFAGQANDRWLAAVCLDELKQAWQDGTLSNPQAAAKFQTSLDAIILTRLACGRLDNLETLNDLAYCLWATKYLPLAESVGKKQFAQWLLDHRSLSRLVFRALGDVPDQTEALKRLYELYQADEKAVLAYEELATAFATARPLKAPGAKQPETATLLECFAWYTNPKMQFAYDLKKMPYELSRFLADSRLSLAERQWAHANYAGKAEPGKSYFDLRYDTDYYRTGTAKKIDSADYTLPNLKNLGGVCIEQAYYSAQVCKSLGIPAAIVVGEGKEGVGHAWLASLKLAKGGNEAYWDVRTGRYDAQMFLTGTVHNPANGQHMADSELVLLGQSCELPLQRREEADTACFLAVMVTAFDSVSNGAAATPPTALLEELAKQYNDKLGKTEKTRAATDWINVQAPLDMSMVEELMVRSADRNLANHATWGLLIKLCKDGRISTDRLDRLFDGLITHTAKSYPDYSGNIVLAIAPTVKDLARREEVLRKSLNIYGGRVDLQGRILIALGDLYREQNNKDKAASTYADAAARCIDCPDVAVTAASKAEAILVESGKRDAAIRMYSQLYGKTKKSKAADMFRGQTTHNQLGNRLADLLSDAGQAEAAKKLRAELEN